MVERGHDDPVGIDEQVAYEYAAVRRFYDKMGISDKTEIEFFNGPHMIHGVGTFEFLRRHCNGQASFGSRHDGDYHCRAHGCSRSQAGSATVNGHNCRNGTGKPVARPLPDYEMPVLNGSGRKSQRPG